MKERASFTFDKETIKIIEKILKTGRYRNHSHIVEDSIKLLGETVLKNKKEEEKVIPNLNHE